MVDNVDTVKELHLHLVSDASGETVLGVARVCLLQFEGFETVEHLSPLIRHIKDVDKVLDRISRYPGLCIFTLVNPEIREALEKGCAELGVPSVPVLDPILGAIANYVDVPMRGRPGRHHGMNSEYFSRIDAMHFVMAHDDGQSTRGLAEADVVLLGVSRTSKTPTCIYLANRGVKAANFPIVPGCALPDEMLTLKGPLVVCLTKDAKLLAQIRRNRLRLLGQEDHTDYTDLDRVEEEVNMAKRLASRNGWHIIDVTRRSIEETAAQIIRLIADREEKNV
ncbi:pyruvate, water dikinase regulatory protein [Magnetospira thiophila]